MCVKWSRGYSRGYFFAPDYPVVFAQLAGYYRGNNVGGHDEPTLCVGSLTNTITKMRDFSKTTSNDLISLVATGDADAIKELRRQMAISDGLIETIKEVDIDEAIDTDGGWMYLTDDVMMTLATECLLIYRPDILDKMCENNG